MTMLAPTRVNLVPNPTGPSLEAVNGWGLNEQWWGNGGAGVSSRGGGSADGPPTLSNASYLRKTWTTQPSSAGDLGFKLNGNSSRIPVIPGQTYSVSYWWRHNMATGPSQARTRVQFWDASSGGTNIATVASPDAAAAFGTWTLMSFTFTVPPGATYIAVTTPFVVWASAATITPGRIIDCTMVLVELSSTTGGYFDGSYSSDKTMTPAWLGTPLASPSILSDLASSVTVSDGTTTVGAVEIVASTLERGLRRTVQEPPTSAEALITAAVPGLLEGQLTFLCASLARALALEALYRGTAVLTLTTSGELTGFRHLAVDKTRLTAEKAVPGNPARWLLTVTVRERA